MVYAYTAAWTGSFSLKCIIIASDTVEPLLTLSPEARLKYFDHRVINVSRGVQELPLGGGRTGRLGDV